eukprot:TRINITY_DN18287_c0_g2_i6.p1 TRINITY_DN18287_c0_g2~~TRINITY_DN18287_c0_g2_i6.p1  ORF type:complete len:222 (+),score=-6.61 TRINITY_DN18287_c0_g2_i6:233-898(+)
MVKTEQVNLSNLQKYVNKNPFQKLSYHINILRFRRIKQIFPFFIQYSNSHSTLQLQSINFKCTPFFNHPQFIDSNLQRAPQQLSTRNISTLNISKNSVFLTNLRSINDLDLLPRSQFANFRVRTQCRSTNIRPLQFFPILGRLYFSRLFYKLRKLFVVNSKSINFVKLIKSKLFNNHQIRVRSKKILLNFLLKFFHRRISKKDTSQIEFSRFNFPECRIQQ